MTDSVRTINWMNRYARVSYDENTRVYLFYVFVVSDRSEERHAFSRHNNKITSSIVRVHIDTQRYATCARAWVVSANRSMAARADWSPRCFSYRGVTAQNHDRIVHARSAGFWRTSYVMTPVKLALPSHRCQDIRDSRIALIT